MPNAGAEIEGSRSVPGHRGHVSRRSAIRRVSLAAAAAAAATLAACSSASAGNSFTEFLAGTWTVQIQGRDAGMTATLGDIEFSTAGDWRWVNAESRFFAPRRNSGTWSLADGSLIFDGIGVNGLNSSDGGRARVITDDMTTPPTDVTWEPGSSGQFGAKQPVAVQWDAGGRVVTLTWEGPGDLASIIATKK